MEWRCYTDRVNTKRKIVYPWLGDLRDVKYLNDHGQAQYAAYRASADGMASPLPEEPKLVCGILL